MEDNLNNDFTFYDLITIKREIHRVAISEINQIEIDKLLEEYNTLEKIPVDKTVRGFFVNNENSPDFDKQENDITINQLRKG